MPHTTTAALVMRVGARLYGPAAVDRLARELPMAKRTVERIAAAARDGEEAPAAKAALRECPRLIDQAIEELTQLRAVVGRRQAELDGD